MKWSERRGEEPCRSIGAGCVGSCCLFPIAECGVGVRVSPQSPLGQGRARSTVTPMLKGGGAGLGAGKRKKKKAKEKAQILEQIVSSKKQEEEKKRGLDKRTPAQVAYEKMQEKRQMERILKKASKTHKQRVEDFNRHLDTLTEHYDIPKVSWTK